MEKFKLFFLYLLLPCSILFGNCSQHNKKEKAVYVGNLKEAVQIVRINEIIKAPNLFEGKFVELIGVYKNGFEESALYQEGTDPKSALWVSFDDEYFPLLDTTGGIDLLASQASIQKLDGKRIKIRGKFNSNEKGHLGSFFGSLENIFYLEVLN